MATGLAHLQGLYSETHDPWHFESSEYERQKFHATRRALSLARYRSAFELGCGNGQLALHLSEVCDRYTGMDAVDEALEAARRKVPSATFVKGFYPCALPNDDFDLIILSEILYFLDPGSIRQLASDIAENRPNAEVLCVSFLGSSGNEMQGREAVLSFMDALRCTHDFALMEQTGSYRIDRGLTRGRS